MPGRPHLIQPGQREWVTTIECINTRGWSLPTCIIFKGRVHIEGWFEEIDLPSSWRIEISANGWTTDEIGLQWLQEVFIPATTPRTVGKYRLLVLDGHGSHLTPQFNKLCKDNNIICLCMPPYSSHLLQPLDIGCFGPLKRAYGQLVEAKMRLGFSHIDKLDFLKAYPAAHRMVFTAQNIRSGFAAAGIEPFEPCQVLDKLNYSLSTPSPPPSHGDASTSSSMVATPYTVRHLHKKTSSIKKILYRGSRSPSTPSKKQFDELIKGCEFIMHQAAFMSKELQDLRAESQVQKQKKSRSKRQMTPNQGLQVQEARDAIASRNKKLNEQGGGIDFSTESAMEPLQPPKRAPPTCSDCHIQGHTRTSCPNRQCN
jgi:hypothetical protein